MSWSVASNNRGGTGQSIHQFTPERLNSLVYELQTLALHIRRQSCGVMQEDPHPNACDKRHGIPIPRRQARPPITSACRGSARG